MEEVSHLIIKVNSNEARLAGNNLDTLSNKAEKTEKATDGLTSSFKRFITVAAAATVFKKVSDEIGSFQESMSAVRAVTNATEEDFVRLNATARELGANTRYSATQSAEGMRFLGQAGFDTNEIISAMPGVLDLATAGQLDLAAAADIASNVLSGFNLNASESGRVSDVLAASASNANTNVYQLGDAMSYVAPIAASLKIPIEETAAAIGILSNAGLQGSTAGTGLRRVLSELASPTAESTAILRAYGLTLEEVNPQTQSLTDIIQRLSEVGLAAGDALQVFGDRGAPAILALTGQITELEKLNEIIDNSDGLVNKMATTMGDNLPGDIRQFNSAISETVLKIGDAGLSKALRDATQASTDFVRSFNDMVESGEISAWADILLSKFSLLAEGFENAAMSISAVWTATVAYVEGEGNEMATNILGSFKYLPENLKAVVEQFGARWALMYDELLLDSQEFQEKFMVYWDRIGAFVDNLASEIYSYLFVAFTKAEIAVVKTSKGIRETLNKVLPERFEIDVAFDEKNLEDLRVQLLQFDFDFGEAEAKASADAVAELAQITDYYNERLRFVQDAWLDTADDIESDRQANINASDDKIAKLQELRAEYARLKAERVAAFQELENDLKPRTGGATSGDLTGGGQLKDFAALKRQLEDEEKLVTESYELRLDLIRRNTKEGTELRVNLERQLNERLAVEMSAAHETRALRTESLYRAEQEALQTQYDNRLINESEFLEASRENWRRYTEDLKGISSSGRIYAASQQLEMYSSVLNYAGDISKQLEGLVSENNEAAKAMFIASKGIAIAQAVVYTELAATKALAEGGIFAGIPMATLIRGLGYASVALMAATAVSEYRGKFKTGGFIGAGGFGIAGEAGAEIVEGPALITSANQTAAKLQQGGNQPVSMPLRVEIYNQVGAQVQVSERNEEDGKVLEVMISQLKDQLSGEVREGGGKFSKALESTYNLRRA